MIDKNNGIGRHLRTLRKMAGMTQAQVGGRAGLSRASIVNIELGNQLLTSKTIVDIADAMGYRVKVSFVRK